ncbi:MAG: hypothetical protein K9M45_14230 [Kiritimatiellales bacterium]|nr:hypothetical protein [Kiritimatiellales bacterium]
MRKSLLWALLLMALCTIIFIFTKGRVDIAVAKLVIKNVPTSMALLVFTGTGIVIGVLLK